VGVRIDKSPEMIMMLDKIRIAVMLFPGNNREAETKTAVEAAGMEADIVRWNSEEDIRAYDGYVLPGGFSYEDRIRAGVIPSKDPILGVIKEEAKKGKPVLGICNGAQALIESKMVPEIDGGKLEMALAPNINPFISGFYCKWVNLKVDSDKKTAFTMLYKKGDVISLPIAHAEGRFTTNDENVKQAIVNDGQIVFKYCTADGNVVEDANPNSSLLGAAAICNKEGNVMALMPHPECGSFYRQQPEFNGSLKDTENTTSTNKIFQSMKKYIEERK